MFTGLVQEVGIVVSASRSGGNLALTVEAGDIAAETALGGSVCVSGVCLTVVKPGRKFRVEIAGETLEKTNLSALRPGSRVNLESPVKAASPFGGHFVTGHVDTTARIKSINRQAGSQVWEIETPGSIARYVVEKGSICVDGASLTVAKAKPKSFTVSLIPHTIESTTFKDRRPGDLVNLEADIIAKHVEKLIHTAKEKIAR